MVPVSRDRRQPTGSMWLLLALAASPFAVKYLVAASAGYLAQSLYKVCQLAAPVYWRRNYGRQRWLACFWPVDQPLPDLTTWALAVSVAIALAGAAVCTVLGLAPALHLDQVTLKANMDTKFSLTAGKAIVIVFYLFTVNAALEELHFRAWLDREISSRWGTAAGILVSAATFATMHLFIFAGMTGVPTLGLVLMFLALLIAGVSWSLLMRRPGGIHAAWLSHGLTDAGLLTWGLYWLGYF